MRYLHRLQLPIHKILNNHKGGRCSQHRRVADTTVIKGSQFPSSVMGQIEAMYHLLGCSERSMQCLGDVNNQDAWTESSSQKQQANQPNGILQNKLTDHLQNCQGHRSPGKKLFQTEDITCNKSFWNQSFYKKGHYWEIRWRLNVKKELDGKNVNYLIGMIVCIMENNVLFLANKHIQKLKKKKLPQSRFPGPAAELNICTLE